MSVGGPRWHHFFGRGGSHVDGGGPSEPHHGLIVPKWPWQCEKWAFRKSPYEIHDPAQ